MTRLESHQRKLFFRRIILYSLALILLLVFLMTIGLKLIINGSLYMSGFNKSSQTKDQNQPDDFYGSVSIDNIPIATNSAKIFVNGSQSNFNILEFYINNEKVDTISDVDTETFSKQIGDLKKGENTIVITAKTKDGKHTKDSETVKVVYKGDKPKLDITSPKDGTKTNNTDIIVSGTTDKDISVKVNDSPVVVNGQFTFQTSVRLKDGDNKIVITAQDDAGNTERKEITVNYNKDN